MVVVLLTIFIVYGSLYPFSFGACIDCGGALAHLIGTWHDWDRRGDLLSNILLYIPFGFFTTQALPARLPAALRAGLSLLAGSGLSIAMELAQFHDAGRVSSMGDVDANAIGSAIGALCAAMVGAGMRWPLVRGLAARPDVSLLLVMFLGYRLYPYVPVTNLHKYWNAVSGMLRDPTAPPDELLRYVVTWLFIAMLIHAVFGDRRWFLLFPLFALMEFAGRVLVINAVLTASDVAGAAIALVLWSIVLHWIPWRGVIVAAGFTGLIVALRLQPFQFSPVALHPFGWVPFWSMMHGSITVAMLAFCEKFYQYGGVIWLLDCIGMPLPVGTSLTAALLFVTSYVEIYLPGRSGEITDAILAAGIGAALLLLRQADTPAPVVSASGVASTSATRTSR